MDLPARHRRRYLSDNRTAAAANASNHTCPYNAARTLIVCTFWNVTVGPVNTKDVFMFFTPDPSTVGVYNWTFFIAPLSGLPISEVDYPERSIAASAC